MTTDGDCGDRPCPDPSCRYSLPNNGCLWDILEEHPDGMSHEQVAEVLGCDRSTVEKIERHALERASWLLRAFR